MIRLYQIGLARPEPATTVQGDAAYALELSASTPYLVGVFATPETPFAKGDFFYDGAIIPNPYALFHPLPRWEGSRGCTEKPGGVLERDVWGEESDASDDGFIT